MPVIWQRCFACIPRPKVAHRTFYIPASRLPPSSASVNASLHPPMQAGGITPLAAVDMTTERLVQDVLSSCRGYSSDQTPAAAGSGTGSASAGVGVGGLKSSSTAGGGGGVVKSSSAGGHGGDVSGGSGAGGEGGARAAGGQGGGLGSGLAGGRLGGGYASPLRAAGGASIGGEG